MNAMTVETSMSEAKKMIDEISRIMERSSAYKSFAERHGIRSAPFLTVTHTETADLIAERPAPRITGKVVIEIGGGIGLLSLAMGVLATRVFCIEANPQWASAFTHVLIDSKPRNVSFLFGAAEEFVDYIKADVAVVCTHSGVRSMLDIGRRFAPEVIDFYGELVAANPDAFDPFARQARLLT